MTVTHPEVTRYFMSVDEAAQLILQAGSMGEGGEIFILKMGQPIKIAEMARELILLCGKDPDTEIEIAYVGLRAGEKLYEELITEGEGIVDTQHSKIMVLKSDIQPSCQQLHAQLQSLAVLANQHDSRGIKSALHVRVISILCLATPSFWLALLLIQWFGDIPGATGTFPSLVTK